MQSQIAVGRGEKSGRGAGRGRDGGRQMAQDRGGGDPRKGRVSGKQFIGAIARQGHGDVWSAGLGEEVCVDVSGVAMGLVEDFHQLRETCMQRAFVEQD